MMVQAGIPKNIVELACERVAAHPDRVALRFLSDGESSERVLTYAELHSRACAIAVTLLARGGAGERALIVHPSGPEYLAAFLGCAYAGWTAVPAHPPQSLERRHLARLLAIVRSARPRALLVPQALGAQLSALRAQTPDAAALEVLETDTVSLEGAGGWRMPALPASSTAFLQFTSGSTAEPKGVLVSHANLVANQAAIRQAFQLGEDDVVVSWLPLFHDMGLVGTLLQPLFSGAELVLFSPAQFIERPLRWLSAISRFRGTVSGGPDFAYRLCTERAVSGAIERLDLSSWRLAFSGAEPVRASTLRTFSDRFAPAGFREAAFYPCYGLAESTLLVSGGAAGAGPSYQVFDAAALAERRVAPATTGRELVAVGQVVPGHELCIVEPETGQVVPRHGVGEIWISGPSVSSGYFGNPRATADVLVRSGERQFLRTGDLGFEHAGQLFISGRRKDMIILRGQNICPTDLEAAVEERVTALRRGRVAAFGFELEGRERVCVAAEVNAKVQKWIDPDATCSAIAEAVVGAVGEAPSVVLLLNPGALPMTSSGKLRRGECRRVWQEGSIDAFAVQERGATRPWAVRSVPSTPSQESQHDNQ